MTKQPTQMEEEELGELKQQIKEVFEACKVLEEKLDKANVGDPTGYWRQQVLSKEAQLVSMNARLLVLEQRSRLIIKKAKHCCTTKAGLLRPV